MTNGRSFDFVVWDWNGTLIDDLPWIYRCGVQRIFAAFSLPCPTIDNYRDNIAADFMPFYRKYGIPPQVTADELNIVMREGFKAAGGGGPQLFPEALDVVKTLRERGYPQAMVSGYDQVKLVEALTRHGLLYYFASVVGNARDKPKLFSERIEAAGVTAAETAIVGDESGDADAARKIGATPFICPRGYHTLARIKSVNADPVFVETLADLLPHFP